MGFKPRIRVVPQCPTCGAKLLEIVFGFPGPELARLAERGKVVLGGCNVPGLIPTHRCSSCQIELICLHGQALELDIWRSPLSVITTDPSTLSVLLSRDDQMFLVDVDESDSHFHHLASPDAPTSPASLLRTSVPLWNRWREDHPGMAPCLAGESFAAANLRGADLENVDLGGASLVGADLREAILCFAILEEAALHDSDLRSANLQHAYLTEAEFIDADLRHCVVAGTCFAGSILDGADLSGSRLDPGALEEASTKGTTLPANYSRSPAEDELED